MTRYDFGDAPRARRDDSGADRKAQQRRNALARLPQINAQIRALEEVREECTRKRDATKWADATANLAKLKAQRQAIIKNYH